MQGWKWSSGHNARSGAPRGVEWAKRRVAMVAGLATMSSMFLLAPAGVAGAAPALDLLGSSPEKVSVVVTPVVRPDPYDSKAVGDPNADDQNADKRSRKASALHG